MQKKQSKGFYFLETAKQPIHTLILIMQFFCANERKVKNFCFYYGSKRSRDDFCKT